MVVCFVVEFSVSIEQTVEESPRPTQQNAKGCLLSVQLCGLLRDDPIDVQTADADVLQHAVGQAE